MTTRDVQLPEGTNVWLEAKRGLPAWRGRVVKDFYGAVPIRHVGLVHPLTGEYVEVGYRLDDLKERQE